MFNSSQLFGPKIDFYSTIRHVEKSTSFLEDRYMQKLMMVWSCTKE